MRATSTAAALAAATLATLALVQGAAAPGRHGLPRRAPAHAPPVAPIALLIVYDGFRPDWLALDRTPQLAALVSRGIAFADHHSIYPTLTNVNAAGLATGAYPGRHGLPANAVYVPAALQAAPRAAREGLAIYSGSAGALAALADAQDGRVLLLETLAERVRAAGGFTAVIGKIGAALLQDGRVAAADTAAGSPREEPNRLLFEEDFAIPRSLGGALGPLPARAAPNTARERYYTDLMIRHALPRAKEAAAAGRPSLLVLWHQDPDLSQHRAGLGTAAHVAALAANDSLLGRLLAALDSLGIADRTNLFVVADHGFATVKATVDVAAALIEAGLKRDSVSADVVLATNGGTDLIYVPRQAYPSQRSQRDRVAAIVAFLARQPWAAGIFVKDALGPVPGALSQGAAFLDGPRSPEIFLSLASDSAETNALLTGPERIAVRISGTRLDTVPNRSQALVLPIAGTMYSEVESGYSTGMGMHGSLGFWDIHGVLYAAGPSFRPGWTDSLPTSNADLAPTVLATLGLAPGRAGERAAPGAGPPSFEGRVLVEALRGGGGGGGGGGRGPGAVRLDSAVATLAWPGGGYRQSLRLRRVGRAAYLHGIAIGRTGR